MGNRRKIRPEPTPRSKPDTLHPPSLLHSQTSARRLPVPHKHERGTPSNRSIDGDAYSVPFKQVHRRGHLLCTSLDLNCGSQCVVKGSVGSISHHSSVTKDDTRRL